MQTILAAKIAANHIFHTLDKKVWFTAQIEKSDASDRDDIIGLYTLCGRGYHFQIINLDA
uniref:Uncharacterized protein n=1 Tax=Pristionchus pacificus TaxID=54126 RepID=A0A2A6C1A6_PRIPA|eukprot:PDM71898.1 hypothetical protein PRIPAC_38305 [Pristionchus pacificus]